MRGIYPVLTTPYAPDGAIDLSALGREIDYVFATGAHGITCALVSDVLRMTADERMTLPEVLVRLANGRGPVIMSVGAEGVPQACHFARAAEAAGVSAIMAIPPVALTLDLPALARYYGALLEAVALPVVLQDASGYLGQGMSVTFQAELHQRWGDRLWFKPEAEPLGPRLSALRDATGGQAVIFEGSGGIALLDAYQRGVRGTMPGCDLLDAMVAIWTALEADNLPKATALYLPLCALVALQLQGGLDGFIAIERHLLTQRGVLPPQRPREPFSYVLDHETLQEVDRLFSRLQEALSTP